MTTFKFFITGIIALSSVCALAADGPGVVCVERNKKPNGAFVSFVNGRNSKPSEFKWAGLETENQILMSENEWPLGTYAGVSPYGDHVVLTIHTISPNPQPRSEFIATLTFFEYGEPRVDTADCYYRQ